METHHQTRCEPRRTLTHWCTLLLIAPIRAYQYVLSPWLGLHCRFQPTCSCYAIDAITEHGPGRGLVLAIARLSKCHPWHQGGTDPVPTKHNTND